MSAEDKSAKIAGKAGRTRHISPQRRYSKQPATGMASVNVLAAPGTDCAFL